MKNLDKVINILTGEQLKAVTAEIEALRGHVKDNNIDIFNDYHSEKFDPSVPDKSIYTLLYGSRSSSVSIFMRKAIGAKQFPNGYSYLEAYMQIDGEHYEGRNAYCIYLYIAGQIEKLPDLSRFYEEDDNWLDFLGLQVANIPDINPAKQVKQFLTALGA